MLGRSEAEMASKDSVEKQSKRVEAMGGLMRSKGFVWIATSQFFMGAFQQVTYPFYMDLTFFILL